MKTATHPVLAAVLLSTLCGCSFGPKRPAMAPDMAVEIDTGATGPRYVQHGEGIDVDTMKAQLEKEPEASGYVSGSAVARVTGILLAGAGGAMIGWPAGRAAGGDHHPPWVLAGAGAGVAVTGIVLSMASVWILDAGVREHNRLLHAAPVAALPSPPAADRARVTLVPDRAPPGGVPSLRLVLRTDAPERSAPLAP